MADVMLVALVDDDVCARRKMAEMLERYDDEHDMQCAVQHFESGSALLDVFRSQFDLIILDVALGDEDGFDVAQSIRSLDSSVSIVFATNVGQMAVRGYEVGAMGYLLKPLSYFAVERELNRCVMEKRRRDSEHMLTMPIGTNVARVSLNNVTYLESRKHKVVVHALGARYEFVGALKNVRENLEDQGFFMCSPAYLVNMRHVLTLEHDDCLVQGGDRVMVSRRRRHAFMKALTDFVA